jgi:hydrogenase-4 component E
MTTDTLFAQSVAATTGLLMLTAVLQVWRRSTGASTRLLAVQGAALAALVATIGLAQGTPDVVLVAVLVLALKAVALPWALTRTIHRGGAEREDSASVNPVSGLLAAAALTTLAYAVSQPIVALDDGPAAHAVPAGVALVLIGFFVLATRRRAVSQLIGFLVIDNGIATVAFLTAGGVPFVVELGVSLDVVLVVLILRVLSARLTLAHGHVDLHDLRELHD